VAKSASAQVSVDGSRVCLEKLSGGVDGLIVRLTLYCWKDRIREARQDVLDCGVLYVYVGSTGVPCCCAGEEAFLGPEAKENGSVACDLWMFVDLF
jgi:hypothetical protein